MVNENPTSGQGQASGQSTGTQGKQQSSEISQGATSQQGSGQGTRGTQDYSGHYGAGGPRETGYRGGQSGQSRWQPSGSALQTRGATPASSYGGYGSLYG